MAYKLRETREAIDDVARTAEYLAKTLKNPKAALNFLNKYDKEIQRLETFPFGYKGIGFEYRGYEIRLKPFDTYNIFFVVDEEEKEISVLKVLKNRQDWKTILGEEFSKNL